MSDLTGKSVLVSGGARGIGKAIAVQSAKSGARVAIIDRDVSAANEVVSALTAQSYRALSVVADIRNYDDVANAVKEAYEWSGRIDSLVNSAGIRVTGGIQDVSAEGWTDALRVNLQGAAFVSKSVIPYLRKAGGGSIVNITSSVVYVPLPNLSAYTASKAGLDGLTRAMAVELAPFNIRVNSVSPGTIRTRWVEALLQEHPEPKAIEAKVRDRHLLRRLGEPNEVASAVVFLLSDEAAFITGSALLVDGGYSINGGYLEG